MSKKMLIDGSHPEETRVVIVDGTRVEELDYESQSKRQLRGNVYLARVTRVEPSLQAAFVEYGGNRHGFLAFSEIHPDYYQIPHEDRVALLEAEQAESLQEEEEEETKIAKKERANKPSKSADNDAPDDESTPDDEDASDNATNSEAKDESGEDNDDGDDIADASEKEVEDEQKKMTGARRKRQSRRRYKIQEVIKRGQILLIQAVKEERGNKGAAMTSYLSLAGRYCVLMPNTPRGGGISRKISTGSDRKRLKSVMSELEVPQGMGVIVRTAGAKRTKVEIKRDYDYLSRLWDTIRDTTLKSIAPTLIHEEGNLVKRSIRDLYGKDIDSVLVQGDEAYRNAKNFIKMLMPSHAKNVQPYKDDIPLFLRYQVEQQIEACLEPNARLKSGGYLVIHPTEALVSVDVNSGRSTKERNVERTALKTNLEAADEVARQMRLRDLAGLVVIDFIDMDENRNNRAVEKRMRDALSRDRARVQMSRISQFGLMEISRQRRRRSLLEGSTASCEHCHGVGRKRSVESSALKALRAVEETSIRNRSSRIRLTVSPDVAAYLFNEKRELINQIETASNMFTEIVPDPALIRPSYEIESLESSATGGTDPLEGIIKENRKNNNERKNNQNNQKNQKKNNEDKNENNVVDEAQADDDNKPAKRKRRRGRRGGRGRRNDNQHTSNENAGETSQEKTESVKTDEAPKETASDTPKPKRARRKPTKSEDVSSETAKTETTKEEPKKKRVTRKKKTEETSTEDSKTTKPTRKKPAVKAKPTDTDKEKPKTKRKPAKEKVDSPKEKTTPKPKAKPRAKTTAKAAAKPKTVAKAKDKPVEDAKPAPKPKPKETKPKATAKKPDAAPTPEAEKKTAKRGWWSKRNPFS